MGKFDFTLTTDENVYSKEAVKLQNFISNAIQKIERNVQENVSHLLKLAGVQIVGSPDKVQQSMDEMGVYLIRFVDKSNSKKQRVSIFKGDDEFAYFDIEFTEKGATISSITMIQGVVMDENGSLHL